MKHFRPGDFAQLVQASRGAVAICEEHNEPICMVFKLIAVVVWPGNTVEEICDLWRSIDVCQRAYLPKECSGK